MAVQELKLTEKIQDKLGEEGVERIAAHLWARDCQTCGGSLRGSPPALYVIDMHTFAFAELHHEQCRPPDWNDSGMVTSKSSHASYLSHESLSVVLPFSVSGQMDLRPALLVNPGLEMVLINRDENEQWQVEVGNHFDASGLRPMGQVQMEQPVSGATATLSRFQIAVTFTGPPFETYSAPIGGPSGDQIRAAHQDKQGVLLVVSHLFDFTAPTPQHISEVLSSGSLKAGWVGFASKATA